MPTVTWSRLDGDRRAAVVAAAEAEFAAHGFSRGSLNVIARTAGVAKGSLFQYFADKRDLYALHHRRGQPAGAVPTWRTGSANSMPAGPSSNSSPICSTCGSRTSPSIRGNARCTPRRVSRSTPTRGSACGRSSTATTWRCCDLWCTTRVSAAICAADADTEALLSLLLMILPHLALAPYVRGMDPVLGLDELSPEQPALVVRRYVAVLAAAFAACRSTRRHNRNHRRRPLS